MSKFNNSIVNRVAFSSNKYAYRDAYSALKSTQSTTWFHGFRANVLTLLCLRVACSYIYIYIGVYEPSLFRHVFKVTLM